MSDAVVPHTQPSKGARPASPGWFKRAIDSDLFYSFRRSKLTVAAAAVTILFFLLAIFAPALSVQNPFDPAQLQLINSRFPPLWEADGQAPYLLGTDEQGRDMLSAILYGMRVSLIVGGIGSLPGTLIGGLLIGVASGITAVFFPAASEAVIYVLMAVILLTRPRGLFGEEGMMS